MTGMYVSEAVICHGVLDISQYQTNEMLRYDWLWVFYPRQAKTRAVKAS